MTFNSMVANLLYVVDTHILIWYFIGSKRLDEKTRKLIDETRLKGGRLLIPTIVLSEALDVSEKFRVKFDFNEMYRIIMQEPEFEIVDLNVEIFEETIQVIGFKDIHDRIIIATARFYGAGVLTKDQIILSSSDVESL
jgi:PIN domain nuclease of toxin-antitoxin system